METESGDLTTLRTEFDEKKKELSKLRAQLNPLNSQKEQIFQELRSLRNKFKPLQERIKTLKNARDDFTKQVKTLKEERTQLNLAVKEKSVSKKEVDQKKKEMLEKVDLGDSPARIKAQIRKLEEKIETEVIPFSQEEKIRKIIKGLKAQYNQVKGLDEVWKAVNTTGADFAEARRKAEQSHRKVQELAGQSQEKHTEINKLYRELKELRKNEHPLAEKYLDLKAQCQQLKKSLDGLFQRVNELSKLFTNEDRKSRKQILREKTSEVVEKIRKRQKLSTEDILAFQATEE